MAIQAQDDLAVRLNTTGAFDTPWLKEQLRNWNAKEERKKLSSLNIFTVVLVAPMAYILAFGRSFA